MSDILVELKDATKTYRKGGETVTALAGVTLAVAHRGMVAVVGPSGSGKSTLLHLIGGMDHPTSGSVTVAGHALARLASAELTRFRRQTVGFVFQTFNLVPNLTALENVALPMEFNGMGRGDRESRGEALLKRFGLGARLRHYPRELSGGEMQRVAIARALANEPPLVLADEPTGNLDSQAGRMVYELMQEIARERTVLVVTHAEEFARLAARVIHIRDGKLQGMAPSAVDAAQP